MRALLRLRPIHISPLPSHIQLYRAPKSSHQPLRHFSKSRVTMVKDNETVIEYVLWTLPEFRSG